MNIWQRLTGKIEKRTDDEWLRAGCCPECHKPNTLCTGPSGGVGMNVACDQCLSEFVVIPGIGVVIDRNGKISAQRAQQIYGIS